MNELKGWSFSVACTVILISLAEQLIPSCSRAPAARWVLRLILLQQLLLPLDRLVAWLRGG